MLKEISEDSQLISKLLNAKDDYSPSSSSSFEVEELSSTPVRSFLMEREKEREQLERESSSRHPRRLTDSATMPARDGMVFNLDEVSGDNNPNTNWKTGGGRVAPNHLRSAGLHAMSKAVSDEGKGSMRKWVSEPTMEQLLLQQKQQHKKEMTKERVKGEDRGDNNNNTTTTTTTTLDEDDVIYRREIARKSGGKLSRSIPDLSRTISMPWEKKEVVVAMDSPEETRARTSDIKLGAGRKRRRSIVGSDINFEGRGRLNANQAEEEHGEEDGVEGDEEEEETRGTAAARMILYWMVLNCPKTEHGKAVLPNWGVLNSSTKKG